jgi:hypothetical protein
MTIKALSALILALACIVPARAAICHQQVELSADPRWARQDGDNCDMCDFNYVGVGPGERLRWNGAELTEARLAQYLEIVANMEPRPVTLLLIGRAADCALLARIVAAIETRGECYGERCTFGLALPQRPPPRRR